MMQGKKLLREYGELVSDLSKRRWVNLGKTPLDVNAIKYEHTHYRQDEIERGIDLPTHDDRHFTATRNLLLEVADLRDRLDGHIASHYTLPKTKKALQNLRRIYSTLREAAVNHAGACLSAATELSQGTQNAENETPIHSTIRSANPGKKTFEKLIQVSRKHLQALQDLPE